MMRMVCGLAALCLLLPAAAQAGNKGSQYFEWQTQTKKPLHGYSGFSGISIGGRQLYCDYHRIPNRQCVILKSGEQRCKVTGWTLKEFCQ